MSTNATISVKTSEGKIQTIYTHWDGYPSHHLPILQEAFNTQEKAEALIALGTLSVLERKIDAPEGHSFEHPVDGHCIAYHRDRGEDWETVKPRTYASFNAMIILGAGQQYNYLFDNGEWQVRA